MKKSIITVTTLIIVLLITSPSFANDRVLNSTLLGAGGGALLGQAIGGNTESTLIGTVIGGAIGLTAGSRYYDGYGSSSIHVKYRSDHPRYYHRGHKSYRHKDHHYRKYHHRPHYKQYRKHFYKDHHKHYRKSWHHKRHHYSHPGNRVIIKKVYKYEDGHTVRKHVIRERKHHRYERYHRGYGKRFDNRHYNVHLWKRYRY